MLPSWVIWRVISCPAGIVNSPGEKAKSDMVKWISVDAPDFPQAVSIMASISVRKKSNFLVEFFPYMVPLYL
jgi:hypothetical protein